MEKQTTVVNEMEMIGRELGTGVALPPFEAPKDDPPKPPEQDPPGIIPDEITKEGARDIAASAWGFLFGEIREFMPYVNFSPVTHERAVNKTVPVIWKHRDKMPEWLKHWWAEIELGIFAGGLAYGLIKAYLGAKAAAAAEQPKAPTSPAGPPSPGTDNNKEPAAGDPTSS